MRSKEFFQKLKEEFQDHPFRERFLEELKNHAEDMTEDEPISSKKMNQDVFIKKFGRPKEIRKKFNFIMETKYKVWTLFLYFSSILSLYVIWTMGLNEILVPWDVTTPSERPPLGSLTRTINDFFENEGALLINFFTLLLIGISFLISFLRIRKQRWDLFYEVLDYSAAINFLYFGLFFLISLIYFLAIVTKLGGENFNLLALIINLLGIIMLFYMQYTGFTWDKKS